MIFVCFVQQVHVSQPNGPVSGGSDLVDSPGRWRLARGRLPDGPAAPDTPEAAPEAFGDL